MQSSFYPALFAYLPLLLAFGCKGRLDAGKSSLSGSESLKPAQDTRYRDFGANSDCSETPMDLAQFIELTKSIPSSIKDPQQAVLDKLKSLGVLQTFTINFESESAQSSGISPNYPGVIRMRQDGTLIVRYTCDRNADTYGNFEVISFDKNKTERRFQFTSVEMGKAQPDDRINTNPSLCYGCHDYGGDDADGKKGGDLRPNWNMYPDWKGMYGSHDDFFPAGKAEELKLVAHDPDWKTPNHSAELTDYEAFLSEKIYPKSGKADPCYDSLPWLQETGGRKIPVDFKRWPYGMANGSARTRVYATRPNLKFTEVLSKLLALRNYRRLTNEANFKNTKTLLAVEAAGCTEASFEYGTTGTPVLMKSELDQMLSRALPGYVRPPENSAKPISLRGNSMWHFDPRHSSGRAQALFGVWRALGWGAGEWTLVPFESDESNYETGAGPGGNRAYPPGSDLPLAAYTQHEILASVVEGDPELKSKQAFTRARGEEEDFGKHFSCIDDLAGPSLFQSEGGRVALCNALIAKAKMIDALIPQSRSVSRGVSRSLAPAPRVARFDPKKETVKEYLKRTNSQLRSKGEFHYGK
ncbi:MAG: hypothetical protein NTV34_13485 [Proteobacteria bacterium]|nr:hypothetical protein [Pseudomonadota bacterium]